MKFWNVVAVSAAAGVVGFVVGRQVTQAMATRAAARMAAAASAAALKAGTVVATPAGIGTVAP